LIQHSLRQEFVLFNKANIVGKTYIYLNKLTTAYMHILYMSVFLCYNVHSYRWWIANFMWWWSVWWL